MNLLDGEASENKTTLCARANDGPQLPPPQDTAWEFDQISDCDLSELRKHVTSVAPPPNFRPAMVDCSEGRPVVRPPQRLRLHPALKELGWSGLDEINAAAQQTGQSVTEPILITRKEMILAGFGRWQLALFDGRLEIPCIEYALNEDESLQFILTHHQTRRGWNDFVRIRLALTLEPALQQRALDNMRTGGKLKGLANLPEAHRINVREQIARAAGVGDRNVGNVRTILERAHPSLIQALREGTLSINRAIQLCNLPSAGQLEQFISYSEERAINKVIRRSIPQPKEKKVSLNVVAVLDALQQEEGRQPGSVAARIGRHKHTVILIGEDFSAHAFSTMHQDLKSQ